MATTIREIIGEFEAWAPLKYQDDFDNSGLQVGTDLDRDCTGVLVCLDITEEVLDEAIKEGCNMVLSHHPLIFHPLRQVSESTYQQRCTIKAVLNGIIIYSAHTNLDNAPEGVNYKIASLIGLDNITWLDPKEGMYAGSGVVGTLPEPMEPGEFLDSLKSTFEVQCLRHSAEPKHPIRTVALCGGAGAFLLPKATAPHADCFITGELHYHDYFDPGLMLVEMGHYESEHFTRELLRDHLESLWPDLPVKITSINTNPVLYR